MSRILKHFIGTSQLFVNTRILSSPSPCAPRNLWRSLFSLSMRPPAQFMKRQLQFMTAGQFMRPAQFMA